ncbi:MAG: thiamine phosphate synthase [Deltaproteobacteria bacterium]|nr:thiamine phosphate synthase [Deltaproteobacteria bacterium]
MRLIIISPSNDIPNEPEVVCRILQQSSATVHLRKPGRSDRQIADYLEQVPAAFHRRIMVHDHPELLVQFDLKGIHFSEKERKRYLPGLRQLRLAMPGCRLSSAFHRIADIPEPDGLFDYILLSPVFDSISKQNYRAAFEHADLKRFLSRTDHTVFALGGLDAQRAVTAASLGFRGIAVLGAVWGASSPEKAAGQLSAVCRGIETRLVHEIHGH